MIIVPILALAIGIVVGLLIKRPLPLEAGVYVGVAVVAGLDSVLGGIRSALEGKFHTDVFVTGFLANVIIAFFMAWFGDKIGIDLYFIAVLVMGWRVFTNLSLIRRFLLTRWNDARARRRADDEHRAKQTLGTT